MASPFSHLQQPLKIPTEMHSYCSNNAVTLLNTAKSIKIRSIMNFKKLKFTRISSISQPAVRPGSTSATALEFLHNKGNRVRFTKLLFRKNVYPLRHGASFHPLLVSFRLHFTHRKVRNLQKVLINL